MDVELVELGDETIDGREDAFERAAEGAVVESGEDRREIPTRGCRSSGHGETLDAPPAIRRGVCCAKRGSEPQAATPPSTASSTD